MAVTSSFKAKNPEDKRNLGRQYQSVLILLGISLVFFGGIGSRLAYLQLEQGEINQRKADENRTRIIPKPPIRGNIFDRDGRVLATTRLSHSAYIWPKAQKQADWQEIRQLLATILEIPAADIQKRVEEAGINYPSLIPIAANLTPTQVTAIEEYRPQLKWVETDITKIRDYLQGEVAAHVLGYTGELDREELESKKLEGYRLGDFIGKMGVEKSYENLLRGEWGGFKSRSRRRGKNFKGARRKPSPVGKRPDFNYRFRTAKSSRSSFRNAKRNDCRAKPEQRCCIGNGELSSFRS